MSNLPDEIAAFCQQNGMAKTRFGHLALNDKAFVAQLEGGRRVWPETEARVRAFMADFCPPPSSEAA